MRRTRTSLRLHVLRAVDQEQPSAEIVAMFGVS